MYKRSLRFNKSVKENSPYTIFNPHSKNENIPLRSSEIFPDIIPWIQVTCIDPGIYNCGLRVERRYIENGIMKTVTLVQMRLDFSSKSVTDLIGKDTMHYKNSTNILDEYTDHFITSHYILIESQLPINYDLVRMSQHIISHISVSVKDKGLYPLIVEIDPKIKTNLLGAPKKMTKTQRKIWAYEKGIELLKKNGEESIANMIMSFKKKDDHGDVICFCESWFIIMFGKLYIPPASSEFLLSK